MDSSTPASASRIVIRMVVGYFVVFAVGMIILMSVPSMKPIYGPDGNVFDDTPSRMLQGAGVLVLFVWYTVMVARLWKARGGNVVAAVLIALVVGLAAAVLLPSTGALIGPVVSLIVGLLLRSTESDTRTCPFCAERIKMAAVACRHCGRDLPAAASSTAAAG